MFVLFIVLLLGSGSLAAQPVGVAKVWGKVRNMQGDSILLAWHPNALDDREERLIGRLEEDGSFALSLPVNGPVVTELVYGPESMTLWLEPGTDLNVRFKAGDMDYTVKFKGTQAPENTYLADHNREYAENETWQVLPYNIMYYEEGFAQFLDRRLERERADLAVFLSDEPTVSADFREYAAAEINYAWANDRLTYQDLREQVVNQEGRLSLSPGYFEFLRVTHLDANGALRCPTYQTFLTNYLTWQMRQDGHSRSERDYFAVCYNLAKEKFSGEVEAVMLARILRDSFRNGYVQHSQQMLEDYRQNVPLASRYAPMLQAEFDATRSRALGAPAPDFAFQSVRGDTVTLAKLKGKMVYLTLWKTTSGVSLRDLPYQQDLVRKLRGKNVEFVSIALDDDMAQWRSFVKAKNLDGVQLYGGKDAQNGIAKALGLVDVPMYVLLAEDGTIASRKLLKMNNPGAQGQILSMMGKVPMPQPVAAPPVAAPAPAVPATKLATASPPAKRPAVSRPRQAVRRTTPAPATRPAPRSTQTPRRAPGRH